MFTLVVGKSLTIAEGKRLMSRDGNTLFGADRGHRVSRRLALQRLGGGAIAVAGAGKLADRVAAQATPESNTAAASELLQQWAVGWSTVGDPSILLGVVTSDTIYEDVAAGDVVHGAGALQQLLVGVAVSIPDFTVTLQTGFITEVTAAAEYLITSTQSGDLPYLATTEKSFTLRMSAGSCRHQ